MTGQVWHTALARASRRALALLPSASGGKNKELSTLRQAASPCHLGNGTLELFSSSPLRTVNPSSLDDRDSLRPDSGHRREHRAVTSGPRLEVTRVQQTLF